MVNIRSATFDDWFAIADLHARSWRQHYRGNFTDEYLDGPVFDERAAVWQRRFTEMPPNMKVFVAEQEGQLLGFVCYLLRNNERYGSLIDNLHVSSAAQGLGIGRSLLLAASSNIKKETTDPRFYLYVLCDNEAAIGFYERLGGKKVNRESHSNPGGEGTSEVYKIAWPDGLSNDPDGSQKL